MVYKHIEGVKVKSIFSKCNKFRYTLTIKNKLSSGNKTISVIMQNPSEANSEVADKSVQFLEKLIFQKNYTEFKNIKTLIVVNQFAFIQTTDFVGTKEHIGSKNDKYIKKSLNAANIILVAWGSTNSYTERINEINGLIRKSDPQLLLQTKKHPSRGTYIDFVKPYVI